MARPPSNQHGITEDGLRRLLAALSDDPDKAGKLYLLLQRKLIRYFQWNHCPQPELSADEALDRAARRFAGGEQVRDPVMYVLGVARRILLENKRRNWDLELPVKGELAQPSPLGHDETNLARLDSCLAALPPESRALLLEYYGPSSEDRAVARQNMADRMGLDVNALRNRVLRLRRNLERQMEDWTCEGGETEQNNASD